MKFMKKPAAVFMLFYLFYSSIYIARINFSVASAILLDFGILDIKAVGIIGSIFFVTYALSKLISGYFGDRLSPRTMITAGLFLAGAGNIAIGIHTSYSVIALAWGLNAFGQAMIWGPMLKQFSYHYSSHKMKTRTAFLVTSVSVGSIAGLLISDYCVSHFSIEFCFIIPGVISLVMCITAFALLEKPRRAAIETGPEHPIKEKKFFCKETLLITAPAFIQGMIKENITIWMALYFVDMYKIDIKNLTGFIFFLPLMGLLGRVLFPPLFKLFRRNENLVSVFSFLICVIFVLPLIFGEPEALTAVICLGLISASVSIINTHMLSAFPSCFAQSGNISFVASVMDVIVYAGAGIGSLCFGMIINRYGYPGMYAIWGFASLVSVFLLLSADRAKKKAAISLYSNSNPKKIEY